MRRFGWLPVLLLAFVVLAATWPGARMRNLSPSRRRRWNRGPAPPPPRDLPACPESAAPLVTDLDVRPAILDLPRPAARVPFGDPTFGTCLVRVTDHAADLPDGKSPGGLKNEYARVQSFNADKSPHPGPRHIRLLVPVRRRQPAVARRPVARDRPTLGRQRPESAVLVRRHAPARPRRSDWRSRNGRTTSPRTSRASRWPPCGCATRAARRPTAAPGA